jgi:hypothetical protein
MVSLSKTKTTSFYMVLSSLLIISGLALVVTADYSTRTTTSTSQEIEINTESTVPFIETLNETEAIYPLGSGGPDYISKNSQLYEFCKQSKCWGFDASIIELTNSGEAYEISSRLSDQTPFAFSPDHQNFNLSYANSNVYLCSDEFCWIIEEGINNIQPTDQFQNLTGKNSASFGEMKPLEL